jgi:hypothetical protein
VVTSSEAEICLRRETIGEGPRACREDPTVGLRLGGVSLLFFGGYVF